MELGFVGLGKMGANMVKRLRLGDHRVVVYDRNPDVSKELGSVGAEPVFELTAVPQKLSSPRAIWIMVPAGDPVDQVIETLLPHLSPGDILIDGGNSFYKETIRRAEALKQKKIEFVDSGTSGGVWGLKNGYCLMVGSSKEAFKIIEPVLKTLAPPQGLLHAGPPGAGHYVKMIHNGIEYGLMQAYAEGFDILQHAPYEFDLPAIAALWNRGSVVRSWLLELAENALREDPDLEKLKGFVQDSGEGRWTVKEAIDLSVPSPVITASLQARFRSRIENTFSDRFLSALRNQFGGHAVEKA